MYNENEKDIVNYDLFYCNTLQSADNSSDTAMPISRQSSTFVSYPFMIALRRKIPGKIKLIKKNKCSHPDLRKAKFR